MSVSYATRPAAAVILLWNTRLVVAHCTPSGLFPRPKVRPVHPFPLLTPIFFCVLRRPMVAEDLEPAQRYALNAQLWNIPPGVMGVREGKGVALYPGTSAIR